MSKLKKLFQTSIFKTLRFNVHYFGFKSIIKPYVLIARGVQFKCLRGSIELDNKGIGVIQIGYPSLGTQNDSVTKGTINLAGHVIVHDKAYLARGSSLDCGENGTLEIGSLVMTGDSKIICKDNIRIGNECMISWGVFNGY